MYDIKFNVQDVVDLSVPFTDKKATVHPCFPQPERRVFSTIKKNGYNSNVWTFVEHAGTHIVAPNHFIERGVTIDKLSLSRCIGMGIVLDLRSKPPKHPISRDDVVLALKATNNKVVDGSIILLLTDYSSKAGSSVWLDHPGLTEESAKLLVEMGARAVGIDAPTPDLEGNSTEPAHVIFLAHSIPIYENLTNLTTLVGKRFLFVGCPVPFVNGTGSPVRAIALVLN